MKKYVNKEDILMVIISLQIIGLFISFAVADCGVLRKLLLLCYLSFDSYFILRSGVVSLFNIEDKKYYKQFMGMDISLGTGICLVMSPSYFFFLCASIPNIL